MAVEQFQVPQQQQGLFSRRNKGIFGKSLSYIALLGLLALIGIPVFWNGAAYAIDEPLANGGAGSRRDAFGFFVGPKVTLEVKAARWLRLFASYGKGFRSPQARSLGDGENAPLTEVHSSEVGARWSFGPLLRGSVAGFLTYVGTDFVFDHASGRNILTGEALRTGVAWLVESQPARFAKLRVSGTWARAQKLDGAGTLLPYAPTLVMRGDLDLRQRVGTFFGRRVTLLGGIGATVLGSRPLPFGERSKALALVELNAGVEVGPLTFSFEVYNLADVRWRDGEFVFSSNWNPQQQNTLVPVRHFTAGRPLTVQGTLSARF